MPLLSGFMFLICPHILLEFYIYIYIYIYIYLYFISISGKLKSLKKICGD